MAQNLLCHFYNENTLLGELARKIESIERKVAELGGTLPNLHVEHSYDSVYYHISYKRLETDDEFATRLSQEEKEKEKKLKEEEKIKKKELEQYNKIKKKYGLV